MSIVPSGSQMPGVSIQALKTLVNRHRRKAFGQVAKPGTRAPSRDVIGDALAKEVEKHVLATMRNLFGATPDNSRREKAKNGHWKQDPSPFPPSSGRQFPSAIDQMVAEALMRGRYTSNVLSSIFGIIPLLIRR